MLTVTVLKAVSGHVQRRPATVRLNGRIGASLKQRLCPLRFSVIDGIDQWRPAIVALFVQVGPCADQKITHVCPAVIHREIKRGLSN